MNRIITISRQFGSGGRTVGRQVAEKLGIPCYDQELLDMTIRGFIIFSASFLFVGYAMFFSSFFTALGDGLTSAIISFMRTLVFQIAAVLILPLIWGIDGIWWSISVAEAAAVAVGLLFLFIKQKKFHY